MKMGGYFSRIFKKEKEIPLIDRLEDLIESDPMTDSETTDNDSSEIALVSNVLSLKDLTAGDVMVPRVDIVAANMDTTLDEFVNIFSKNNFSQIPVYNKTLDDVVGIVKVRDFLQCIKNPDTFNIKSIVKEVIYVVPSMQLIELLVEIRSSDNHMALVVDEFGGVDGLVTLQDVVTEIVGEIQNSQNMLQQIIAKQDGTYVADAKTTVSECEEILNVSLLTPFIEDGEEPDIETLGGLTTLLAGRMPTRGEAFTHPSGFEFEILDADLRKVKRIAIKKISS